MRLVSWLTGLTRSPMKVEIADGVRELCGKFSYHKTFRSLLQLGYIFCAYQVYHSGLPIRRRLPTYAFHHVLPIFAPYLIPPSLISITFNTFLIGPPIIWLSQNHSSLQLLRSVQAHGAHEQRIWWYRIQIRESRRPAYKASDGNNLRGSVNQLGSA